MSPDAPEGVDPGAWDRLVKYAEELKADHFAGHPDKIGGDRCDWCIAEQLAAEGYFTCQWFLLCENRANGSVRHPILGAVPICDRCRKIAEA